MKEMKGSTELSPVNESWTPVCITTSSFHDLVIGLKEK